MTLQLHKSCRCAYDMTKTSQSLNVDSAISKPRTFYCWKAYRTEAQCRDSATAQTITPVLNNKAKVLINPSSEIFSMYWTILILFYISSFVLATKINIYIYI